MVPVSGFPREPGGWWHRYVCPTHGVQLDFAPGAGVGPCRYGCRWDTPEIRGAWRVLAHQVCAAQASVETLRQYEEFYFGLDRPLFDQPLTEAVWAVSIGLAARRHGNPVPKLLAALAESARRARDEVDFRSNYVAWYNAAGAVCTDDRSFVESQQAHVMAATHEDGWEWEGSTYYHMFVLRAYELSLPDPRPERLDRMRDVASVFAGTALHDSPFGPLPHASAPLLVPATPADPRDRVFPDAGYAVVHSAGIRAILDFGPHGGGHGHRDKLALYLYPWQPDYGQVPYGHRGWRDYYASTRAHPTFRIDDMEQTECAGYQLDTHTFACDEAYEGVRAIRRVTPIEGGLLDELTVTCDRPRKVTLQLRPAVPLRVEGMTTHWPGLTGVHTADTASEFAVKPGPGPADDPQRTINHVDWSAYDATRVTFRSEYRCLS